MTKYQLLRLFKDPGGNIVIWQSPNLPLIGWAVCKALSMTIDNRDISAGLAHIATLLLFTWAYLEIKDGASVFRKILGIVIMSLIIHSMLSAV